MMLKNLESKLVILSIQITLAYLWILAAIPKLTNTAYIEGFEKRFAESFLASLPGGMAPQVYFLGILELVAGILAIISIAKFEFQLKSMLWLKRCLAISALTFVSLGFGLRLIQDHAGSANIFFYLSGTVVFYILTLHLESKAS